MTHAMRILFTALTAGLILSSCLTARSEVWTVTAYCACAVCTDYGMGITASGKRVRVGHAAANCLPFGTKLYVEGYGEVVIEDRGSEKWFGTMRNPKRRLDIYFETHAEAVAWGVKKLNV